MLKDLFSFNYGSEYAIGFTQLNFWILFLFAMIGLAIWGKKPLMKTIFFTAIGLFFYFKTSGVFVILLLFTIISDYNWGKQIDKTNSESKRKLFLTISVILNLTLLCYFKYAYFFADSFNQITDGHLKFFNHFAHFSNTYFSTSFSVDKLLLPVGVSFFTFQSLSYTIDLYRKKIKPVDSVFDYGFFVCFFPHLVAGPIVKANEFVHQIYQPYKLSKFEFGMAAFWIINGFCKKIVADYLAVNFIDRILFYFTIKFI